VITTEDWNRDPKTSNRDYPHHVKIKMTGIGTFNSVGCGQHFCEEGLQTTDW